jgi:hypothetical protein
MKAQVRPFVVSFDWVNSNKVAIRNIYEMKFRWRRIDGLDNQEDIGPATPTKAAVRH